MKRDMNSPGSIVVDHEIVDADDAVVGENNVIYLLDELRVGSLPQQRTDGISGGIDSRDTDKNRHRHTAITVHHEVGEMGDQKADKDNGSGADITDAVRRGCGHGDGLDALAHASIVERHITFDADGHEKNRHDEGGAFRLLGVNDLDDGILEQLKCHKQDEKSHHKPGDIFKSAVPEGVVGVGVLPRELEAKERHDGRARVRKIIKGVRRDCDRTAEHPGDKLSCKEQEIQGDSNRATEHSISLTHLWIVIFRIVFDENSCK